MNNPAREKFLPLLSPYVDGELSPEQRQQVEQHLQHSRESAALVADLRAASSLTRVALEMEADSVDWQRFNAEVMAKVAPGTIPLFERLKLSVSELLTYQRGPMVAAFAGAAVAVLVALPVSIKLAAQAPEGYASSRVEVQTVSVEADATVRPVITETENGDAVIWLVQNPGDDGGKKRKRGGEEGEEDLKLEAPEPPKAGDL
jgi:anti-sigma factor RsiW